MSITEWPQGWDYDLVTAGIGIVALASALARQDPRTAFAAWMAFGAP